MLYKKDPDILKAYFEDSSNLRGGYADEVAIPENIGELSQFLKDANSAKLPVTISGGGTGTTGSRIPFGGVVVSLEKLSKIIRISNKEMTAVVETGVMVDELKKAADIQGMFYTSHPTEGSASVGGTVATNASGSRSFKYGPTRNYVKRLKMVMTDGKIVELRRGQETLSRNKPFINLSGGLAFTIPFPTYKMPNVKSSAGYFIKDGMDVIDLFIGQEGTLSVITEIEIALVKKPYKILSAFVFFGREEDAWHFASDARDISKNNRDLPDILGIDALSIEYFDKNALMIIRDKGVKIPDEADSAIFFEQDIASDDCENSILKKWMDLISKHSALIDDTWVAMNERDVRKFTEFRHAIPEAINGIIKRNGFQKLSADIAVSDASSLEMLRFYNDELNSQKIDRIIFGHIGENHLHVNIMPKSDMELSLARELVLKFVKKGVSLGGSVSAEHGIGKIKHPYLLEMYGTNGVMEMSKVKRALDPNCILGLGNIFPRDLLSYA